MKGVLIAVFIGWLGGYRFYKGQKGLGVLYLFTLGLAGIGWAFDIVQAVKASKPKPIEFEVAGCFAYRDNITSLGTESYNWSKSDAKLMETGKSRVYRYNFPKVAELVPEPDNAYDRNAIAVYVDGVKVGHVPAELCGTVKKMLKMPVSCHINGGDYKRIQSGKVDPMFCDYNITIRIGGAK